MKPHAIEMGEPLTYHIRQVRRRLRGSKIGRARHCREQPPIVADNSVQCLLDGNMRDKPQTKVFRNVWAKKLCITETKTLLRTKAENPEKVAR